LNLKEYISELKRRNVFRAAIAYLVVAWLVAQVVSIFLPAFNAPPFILKTILFLLTIGFPIWLLFAWVYEMTPEGIKKTEEVDQEKSILPKTGSKFNKLIIVVLIFVVVFLLIKPSWKTKMDVEGQIEEIDSNSKTGDLTSNLKALDFYYKGEFHHKKETFSDIDTAIAYYKKAIEIDTEFAMAYNKLASAYMRKSLSFDPDPKWEEEAYSAAGKALQLNSALANPHVIQGQFYWSQSHNFAHEEAINEFVRAIVKDPELSVAYEQLALVQFHIGLFDDALKNAQKSLEEDPGNFRARRFIGETLFFQGEYNSSLKEFEKIPVNFAPQFTRSLKALNFFYLNQSEKAVEILNTNLKNDPDNPYFNSVYAILMASEGRNIEVEEKIKLAFENSKNFIHAHHIYYYFGIASALMNDKQEAVDWLNKAAKTGFPNYPLFHSDPNLINLKGYQEYEELLVELKEKWEYYKTL
jgi:tetratricopeptide (TPR) repeat protein